MAINCESKKGVAKSTTVVTLGHGLTGKGKTVFLWIVILMVLMVTMTGLSARVDKENQEKEEKKADRPSN